MFNRFTSFLIGLTLLCCAAAVARAQDATLIDIRAEYAWRLFYSRLANNKAIAVASNGAYGMAAGESFVATAESKAMAICNERSKLYSLRQPQAPSCELLASRDEWMLKTLTLAPAWQAPAEGKDTPMRKGRKHLVKNPKGIILHVHGCNGIGDRIFTDVWGAYFNAIGFSFYAPDSFAVKRPKEVCGVSSDYPADQVSAVWRLRMAQTQRTLADLRKANPGKPIYLWGHSEGGLIVQMVEADVAGIIVSGEECGVMGGPPAAPEHTAFLYLWGEFDQYVNGLGVFKVDANNIGQCAERMRPFTFHNVVLPGRGHIPFPWHPKINEAVSKFLNVSGAKVQSTAMSKDMRRLWKRTKQDKRYRTGAGHRAAAINSRGASYMVWGLDNEEDARELALFGCARTTARSKNLFTAGKHLCALADLNGAAPK